MMFDNYTLKARYYPMVIMLFPIVILGIFYSIQFNSPSKVLVSFGVVSALTYFFSQLGRDNGKRKESRIWNSWGGMPTVQLLRLHDSRIDPHTKQRYHEKLQILCPVSPVPTLALEVSDAVAMDDIYKSWTRYLLSQTRDPKKFPLLLKDNTSYGFRRNLWGLKPYAILLILLCISADYLFWFAKIKSANPMAYPDNFKYSTFTLMLLLAIWILIITKNWIKIPAFSYAERLCETTENIL